jgi:phosphate transport system substrate-binding protein
LHPKPTRRLIVLALVWSALAPVLAACTPSSATGAGGVILAGSTSVQPFAELLAEAYARQNPQEPVINIQGGGSTAGIEAVLSGTAHIGMSSRALREPELAQGLTELPIAYDAIAIVVHVDNPISALTSDQVRRIFSGEVTNWSQLGGMDSSIHVVTREEGSGTRGAFEELLMGGTRITDRALRQDSNGAVRVIVNSDPAAIGYISLGIVGTFVKPVALDGVAPTAEAALAGEYRLVRPFIYVWQGELNPPARRFVDYCLSPNAQAILADEGLIPVTGG